MASGNGRWWPEPVLRVGSPWLAQGAPRDVPGAPCSWWAPVAYAAGTGHVQPVQTTTWALGRSGDTRALGLLGLGWNAAILAIVPADFFRKSLVPWALPVPAQILA